MLGLLTFKVCVMRRMDCLRCVKLKGERMPCASGKKCLMAVLPYRQIQRVPRLRPTSLLSPSLGWYCYCPTAPFSADPPAEMPMEEPIGPSPNLTRI